MLIADCITRLGIHTHTRSHIHKSYTIYMYTRDYDAVVARDLKVKTIHSHIADPFKKLHKDASVFVWLFARGVSGVRARATPSSDFHWPLRLDEIALKKKVRRSRNKTEQNKRPASENPYKMYKGVSS